MTIQNGSAPSNENGGGGGILSNNSNVTLENVTVKNNNSTAVNTGFAGSDFGGGITNYIDSTLTLISSTVTGNTAKGGAGIYNASTLVTKNNSLISKNTAKEDGGGIFNTGIMTVEDSDIVQNNALRHGGGIRTQNNSVTIKRSTIDRNTAGMQGGGIDSQSTTVTIDDSIFTGNTAASSGGGFSAGFNSMFTLVNSTIVGNKSDINGGGFSCASGGTAVTVTNSTISGNSADADNSGGAFGGGGGGFNAQDCTITMAYTTMKANTTPNSGEGMRIAQATINIKASILDNVVNAGEKNCFIYVEGTINSNGYNIENGDSCNLDTNKGDQKNTNPKLSPLQGTSGLTNMHILMNGSPALQAIPNGEAGLCDGTVTKDQRGENRPAPSGGNCDIGAYEKAMRVDLVVAITDVPDPVTAGETLTYAVTVTNNGPEVATGIRLDDVLTIPKGLTAVSIDSTGWTCIAGVVPIEYCLLDADLVPGTNATLTYVTKVKDDTVGVMSYSAAASSKEDELSVSNNTVTVGTNVPAPKPTPESNPEPVLEPDPEPESEPMPEPEAETGTDLSISVTDTPDPVVPGKNVTYAITATNNGPDYATGVKVTDTLPAGATFISAVSTQGTCSAIATVVTCMVGGLLNNSSVVITVTITTDDKLGTLINTVGVVGEQTDPTPSNNGNTVHTSTKEVESGLSATEVNVIPDTPLKVPLGSTSHIIVVKDIGTAEITVTLESGELTLTLNKGESKEVDKDGDGSNDLRITYVKDGADGYPVIKLTELIVIQEKTCALLKRVAYKHAGSPAVYYITDRCTRRAFTKPNVFFTYFGTWSDVRSTTKAALDNIADDILGFMPFGKKYDPQYGALVKTVFDPKVYLLLGTERYWITSEDVFTTLHYKWNWIEDVSEDLLQNYTLGSEINYTNHHPNFTLIKYPNNPKVYRLKDGKKQYIKNEKAFNKLRYRWDRIVEINTSEVYANGEELQ